MNIIFGPIHSRRFGTSLGVDLSPSHKQCNFDCLYCELAPMATVSKQSDVVSVDAVIAELKKHLHEKIDVITLTANGEPTLYPYLDELIDAISKIKGETQTLILTNSATLVDEKVFQSLLKLDQVKLSLDAVTPEIFKKIDRPHHGIVIEPIAQRVIEFSRLYKGKLFMEVLFVKGLNDTKDEAAKLNELFLQLNATRIDLGTIDRPPAYPIEGISYEELYELSLCFDAALPIHIASRTKAMPTPANYDDEAILNTLDKRPLTLNDVDLLFNEPTQARLMAMLQAGVIIKKEVGNLEFFAPSSHAKRKKQK
ncbi:MAG: radical SAM protein [Epsilonproteobacteria bacterium]|nr:radical SAM protein [Campylobacterota bacterium]